MPINDLLARVHRILIIVAVVLLGMALSGMFFNQSVSHVLWRIVGMGSVVAVWGFVVFWYLLGRWYEFSMVRRMASTPAGRTFVRAMTLYAAFTLSAWAMMSWFDFLERNQSTILVCFIVMFIIGTWGSVRASRRAWRDLYAHAPTQNEDTNDLTQAA